MKIYRPEICAYSYPIILKFDRHLISYMVDMLVKFQGYVMIYTTNLVTLRLTAILWWCILWDIERGRCVCLYEIMDLLNLTCTSEMTLSPVRM